jgi:hypothetical protein
MADRLPAVADKQKAAGTRAKVPETPHQWGDQDEVREYGGVKPPVQRQSQAKAREEPERKSSPLKGVSYSIGSALAQIDFGDKIPHDRYADKILSRAASTFFNVL